MEENSKNFAASYFVTVVAAVLCFLCAGIFSYGSANSPNLSQIQQSQPTVASGVATLYHGLQYGSSKLRIDYSDLPYLSLAYDSSKLTPTVAKENDGLPVLQIKRRDMGPGEYEYVPDPAKYLF